MKILLVSPINRTYVVMPMLGLGYLASVAKKYNHSVDFLDCKKEGLSYKGFEDYIENNKYDLICFQVFSYDINSVKRHMDIIRKHQRDAVIIAGGAHPSGDPAGTLLYLKDLDFAFKGESEIGFAEFLKYLDDLGCAKLKKDYGVLRKIPGLIFNAGENEVIVNDPVFVDDLDTIEYPAWELMDPGGYPEAPHGAFARQFPTAPIIITRGCPHSCTFCAGKAITGMKIRKRSIDNVWSEVRYLTDRFGINELLIEDENFTLHNGLLKDFCNKIISAPKRISWSFPAGVRIETLNKDNLRLMEEAGCYSMAIGVEFGSQRIHDLTRKRLTIELIREKIDLLSKTNIKTTGFFLMGIPGESREDILATINLALNLEIDRAQFNNFMPLPGSVLWKELLSNNRLSQIDWDSFFVHDVSFSPQGVTKRELKYLQRLAYVKFYFRPKIIFRIFNEIKSPTHFKMLFKRLLDALS